MFPIRFPNRRPKNLMESLKKATWPSLFTQSIDKLVKMFIVI